MASLRADIIAHPAHRRDLMLLHSMGYCEFNGKIPGDRNKTAAKSDYTRAGFNRLVQAAAGYALGSVINRHLILPGEVILDDVFTILLCAKPFPDRECFAVYEKGPEGYHSYRVEVPGILNRHFGIDPVLADHCQLTGHTATARIQRILDQDQAASHAESLVAFVTYASMGRDKTILVPLAERWQHLFKARVSDHPIIEERDGLREELKAMFLLAQQVTVWLMSITQKTWPELLAEANRELELSYAVRRRG